MVSNILPDIFLSVEIMFVLVLMKSQIEILCLFKKLNQQNKTNTTTFPWIVL